MKKLLHRAGGKVFTRNTKNDYTHVAIARLDKPGFTNSGMIEVASWHGSAELAEKKAAYIGVNGWTAWAEPINHGKEAK